MSKESVKKVIVEAMNPPDLAELLDDLVGFLERFLRLSTVARLGALLGH